MRSAGSLPFQTTVCSRWSLSLCSIDEVVGEPIASKLGCHAQGTGLFEEVRSTRDKHKAVLAVELLFGVAVETNYRHILVANDQQCGSGHRGESRAGQVRAAPPRHHGGDLSVLLGCRPQRGGGPSAGAEVTDR
jgi:hypothetical protein